MSFANGIATIKGGTHVDYVTNQIANHVMAAVNKKNKNANLKAHNVKSHLWVFVNALIDNPAFDSQTKETLTTRQSSFGSKCELSEDFLKKGWLLYSIEKIWLIVLSFDLVCRQPYKLYCCVIVEKHRFPVLSE